MKPIEEELQNKWHDKHIASGVLADSYKRIGYENKSKNTMFCGTQLDFVEDIEGNPKLHSANFCKDRLCPMCAWRRSKKIYGQVSQITEKLEKDYAFVFVTLTLQNCSSENLNKTIETMQKGFRKLMTQKDIKKAFAGYFKALEITYKKDYPADLQYHPHFHTIFAVRQKYFKDKTYITQEKLAKLWKDATNVDYYPIVDIRKIKGKKQEKRNDYHKAVAEVAKYAVKSSEYLRGTEEEIDEAVHTLSNALKGKQINNFGGVFLKVKKELNLDDPIDGDLINTDNQKEKTAGTMTVYKYRWNNGYYLHEITEVKIENDS